MATRASTEPASATDTPTGDGVRRRDFLNVAAVSFAGVGAVAAVGPLLVQASPSASVRALSSVEVDISKIQPGQGIKTTWRKQPVFIKQLTPAEIQAANATPIAARIASAEGIDIDSVEGSGPRGRVTKSDVLAALEDNGAPAQAPAACSC